MKSCLHLLAYLVSFTLPFYEKFDDKFHSETFSEVPDTFVIKTIIPLNFINAGSVVLLCLCYDDCGFVNVAFHLPVIS